MPSDALPRPDFSQIPPDLIFYLGWLHGFQEAYAIYCHVAACDRVLIVGETSGRDSFYLRSCGKWTVAMDIMVHPYIPQLIRGDANRRWPFAAGSFDAVVMSEVLEHLFNDTGALAEARRVLKDDGVLVVTVPFLDDAPFHARLHSPRTIQSLLAVSGFTVKSYYERGALFGLANLIEKLMAIRFRLQRLASPGLGQFESYHPQLVRLATWNLNRRPLAPRRGPFSRYWGCYVACAKGPYADFNQSQEEWFAKGGKLR